MPLSGSTSDLSVAFVNHHDFRSNSGIHIFNLANELAELGVRCTVLVPGDPRSVRLVGELPTERVVNCIGRFGNTSAASIPQALEDARLAGTLVPGAKVLLGAFGAGFTWGATVVEWGSAEDA